MSIARRLFSLGNVTSDAAHDKRSGPSELVQVGLPCDRMACEQLTLEVLEMMFFEESRVGESPSRADAFVGKLVAHIRRSITNGRKRLSLDVIRMDRVMTLLKLTNILRMRTLSLPRHIWLELRPRI